jgi:hypothetical protein
MGGIYVYAFEMGSGANLEVIYRQKDRMGISKAYFN